MPLKSYKPHTPGLRTKTTLDFSDLTRKDAEKSLTRPKSKKAGRNNNGRITMRRRGGGHKQLYRVVDFKRNKFDIPAKVAAIEYDPNRSANIALLFYVDGEKRYILCQNGLKTGETVISGENVEIKVGNASMSEAVVE